MSTSAARTFFQASKPEKQVSGVAVSRGAASFCFSCPRDHSSWSGNRSPRAAITTSGEAVAQSMAAPVPRPPQPITPTRIFSEAPAAQRPPGNVAASEARARRTAPRRSSARRTNGST